VLVFNIGSSFSNPGLSARGSDRLFYGGRLTVGCFGVQQVVASADMFSEGSGDVATVILCKMSMEKSIFSIPEGGVSEMAFLEAKMGWWKNTLWSMFSKGRRVSS